MKKLVFLEVRFSGDIPSVERKVICDILSMGDRQDGDKMGNIKSVLFYLL